MRLCAVIIDTLGGSLLQQRDDIPGILQPGNVGLFGGHREGEESYLQCVVREIQEEIRHFVAADRFERLVSYNGVEVDADGSIVRGEFYIARDVPVHELAVTEGHLTIVEPDKLYTVWHKFAPSTRFAMNALFDK